MGKRKERRLAAMMSANRRVKLDLFAEPSGDLVRTSAHDEVGGDTNQDHRDVVPTSSASSAFGRFQEETVAFSVRQKQENPLLLLGQYSDDEVDEETSKRTKLDADGSSRDAQDDEEPTENVQGVVNDSDITGDKQQSDQVDAVKDLGSSDQKEDGSTDAAAQNPEPDPPAQVTEEEPSGVQSSSDLHGGWKVVAHEDSNQYYYWNTVTGETSWELPAALAGQNVSSIESATYSHTCAADGMGTGISHLISKDTDEHNSNQEIKEENGGSAQGGYDANHTLACYSDSAAGILYSDPLTLSQVGPSMQTNSVSMGQLPVPVEEGHMANDENNNVNYGKPNGSHGAADDHSSQLAKCCESLLLRLEALDRCGARVKNHECIRKEIEIRLSDCNALSSYGSSLLPFWWHTEAQLKQLESSVSEMEASLIVSVDHDDKLEATQNCGLMEERLLQSLEQGSNLIENEKAISSTVKHNCHSPCSNTPKSEMEVTGQIHNSEYVKTNPEFSSVSHQKNEQESESIKEATQSTASDHLLPEDESHVHEDIDMDVEMEVDEEPLSGQTNVTVPGTVDYSSQPEQLIQSKEFLSEFPPLPSDEHDVPPPPEEDWIPPPPPESEPVPPPPPEEPPVPSVPPPYPETIPCTAYPDQYNVGYTAQPYEYYASVPGEATSSSYYTQTDSSHIAQIQAQSYYESLATSALHEVAVDASPAEPVAYYDITTAAISSGPVVSSVGASGYFIESGPFSYNNLPVSDYSGSVGFTMETGSNISLLPKINSVLEASVSVPESQPSTLQAAFVPSSSHSAGNALGNGSTVNSLHVASSKNQTKVTRRKKHTVAVAPSLRSNKKVSSLVDKWKAAKEELDSEEDEEPEDAYDILEKKRRKEIEEWRARQIASGEAQDNANFLPLGGDWRERVKRKRAAAKTEAVQTPTEVLEEEKKQPDLVELSKDLPSGWQAYWDESSKEVYYGNSISSETSWSRPIR